MYSTAPANWATIHRTLTGTTTLIQSRPGSNSNEGKHCVHQCKLEKYEEHKKNCENNANKTARLVIYFQFKSDDMILLFIQSLLIKLNSAY